MKKLSIFLAGMVALLGFSGCEAEKDPVYKAPTEFTMNTSAMENQYITLDAEGTFELTATGQPDYGFSGITEYSAIVSLTPEFTETADLKPTGAGTNSVMTFKSAELAQVICELKGIATEDDYVDEPAIPVYFKGVAQLKGVPESRIVSSNYCVLKQVKYYFAVPTPGHIYLVGDITGWKEPSEGNKAHYANWALYEADDAIGSKVYTGIFEVPASPTFRFYTELTGWDGGASYGYQEEDNATDVEMAADGTYEGAIVKGKGSYHFTNWEGGTMTITVNLADGSLTILPGAQEVTTPQYVYMVGNNGGWVEPSADSVYNDWKLACKDGSGIYTGTFAMSNIPDDKLYCRFYAQLTGWSPAQWSSDPDGGNVDVTSGVPAPTFPGEGCFVLEGVNDHNLTVALNTNDNTVTFTIE